MKKRSHHTEESRRKLRLCIPWNKGKTGIYTKETLEKISLGTKLGMSKIRYEYKRIAKNCYICNKSILVYPYLEKMYERFYCSKACSSRYRSITFSGSNNNFYGKKASKESLEKNRLAHLGKKVPSITGDFSPTKRPEVREKMRLAKLKNPNMYWLGKNRPESTRVRLKLAHSTPEMIMFHRQHAMKLRKSGVYGFKPNKVEQHLTYLFNQHNLPFQYVGNGKFWVGYSNPDFIWEEGRKIIEFDGKYWHSPSKQIIKDGQRNLAYLDADYDVMIINEDNLKDEVKLINEIGAFMNDN